MNKKQKKCKHKFERIGEYRDRIYSETQEKCVKCELIREVGEGDWLPQGEKNARDAYSGEREDK